MAILLGMVLKKTSGQDKKKLGKVWKNNQFRRMTRIRIFKSNVISVLLYRYETWRVTEAAEKLDTLHRNFRQILKIYWPM